MERLMKHKIFLYYIESSPGDRSGEEMIGMKKTLKSERLNSIGSSTPEFDYFWNFLGDYSINEWE